MPEPLFSLLNKAGEATYPKKTYKNRLLLIYSFLKPVPGEM